MTTTIVLGGSVAGLTTALALADTGHSVTLLERDGRELPATVAEAGTDWPRPTVPQSVHSHAFGSLGINLLAERLPRVHRALLDAGALDIDLAARRPPWLGTDVEPGDEQLRMLGVRRSTFDLMLRREVEADPRITLRTGVTVRGLETAPGTSGTPPRVTGVRTKDGDVVDADLVIDATGRKTAAADWLADAGVPAPGRTSESCDITYYTRFYRRTSDEIPGPLNRGFGAGGLWDHTTAVLFLGDGGTFSISLGVLPDDTPMKALRTEEAFTAAIRAIPLLAPWLDVAEPISPVRAMAGLDNTIVDPADAQTALAGFHQVGDAAATTNPAYGRGVSLAMAHAYALADVLAECPEPGPSQTAAVSAATQELLRPWFDDAVRNDRGRAGLWRATVHGGEVPQPPPGVLTFGQVAAAGASDVTIWRRMSRMMMSLDPPSTVYDDPDIRERVAAALSAPAGPGPAGPPAPQRDEFLRAVTGAKADTDREDVAA